MNNTGVTASLSEVRANDKREEGTAITIKTREVSRYLSLSAHLHCNHGV